MSLKEIQDAFKKEGIEPSKDIRVTKHMAAQLLVLFSLVQDSRVQGMCDYPLNYIILIAFLAILSGAETWMDIHLFAVEKHKWLKRVMKVDYGIPSHISEVIVS